MKRVVLVLAILLTACNSGGEKDEAATPTTTTVVPTPGFASVDWKARTVEFRKFLMEYSVNFCEGAGPLICVSLDGDVLGVIELISRTDGSEFTKMGAPEWSERFIASIRSDRKRGCDPGYDLSPDKTIGATVAGRPGFRYSFTGRIKDRIVERVVGYGTVIKGDLHILVMNALADNGCLNRESELPLQDAKNLEPVLESMAAGSTNLPNP